MPAGERRLQPGHFIDQGAVLSGSVEQCSDCGFVGGDLRLGAQPHGEAAIGADVLLQPLEGVGVGTLGRKHVDAVAQHRAAGVFQRSPEPHAKGRIARRKAEYQGLEHAVMLYVSQKSAKSCEAPVDGARPAA